jgi:hypothetical protein
VACFQWIQRCFSPAVAARAKSTRTTRRSSFVAEISRDELLKDPHEPRMQNIDGIVRWTVSCFATYSWIEAM